MLENTNQNKLRSDLQMATDQRRTRASNSMSTLGEAILSPVCEDDSTKQNNNKKPSAL